METETETKGSSAMEKQSAGTGARVRAALVKRKTNETDIQLALTIDGEGRAEVSSGIGFFDHMLAALAKHSLMDLEICCRGDLYVDGHHTVEDVGICLGQALAQAVGDKKGMARYGEATIPLDEALVQCVVDFSGRPYFAYRQFRYETVNVGDFPTELAEEFFRAVAVHAGITLHLRLIDGHNSHHIIEAAFKAFARALRAALRLDERVAGVPSTKGVL